jgi:hypothetical protein
VPITGIVKSGANWPKIPGLTTALGLRRGHPPSLDFDFCSREGFDPGTLAREIPYIAGPEQAQVVSHTLTCRAERSVLVLVSVFGNLTLGEAAPREITQCSKVHVASLLEIAGTKAAVALTAQPRDYLDIDALVRHGIDLPRVLATRTIAYRRSFNPLINLKALSCFDDVPALPIEVQQRLRAPVEAVDPCPFSGIAAEAQQRRGRVASEGTHAR